MLQGPYQLHRAYEADSTVGVQLSVTLILKFEFSDPIKTPLECNIQATSSVFPKYPNRLSSKPSPSP